MFDKIDSKLIDNIKIQATSKSLCIVRFVDLKAMYDYIKLFNIENCECFESIKSVVLNLDKKELFDCAGLDSVAYISSISNVCAMVNLSKNIIGISKDFESGGDFSIAVIDTGIYPHLDFMISKKNKIIKFIDFVSGKNCIYDDNGHGTFVASLLAGNGTISGNKYIGIDKNISIIPIKALDKNGESNTVTILRAMQWVYDNMEKYNIKIVCMSFGSTVLEKNDPLILGAEALWDKGVVVVSACGNSGPESSTIKSPSASKKIISVGALDDHRVGDKYDKNNFEVAEFSSRGPIMGNYKPDLIVSGVDVVSACHFGIYKKFYNKMSGTSVATPIVAGVVSRLIKKYPNHTPDQIKKVLINNCHPITGDRNSEGFGWLDLRNIFD